MHKREGSGAGALSSATRERLREGDSVDFGAGVSAIVSDRGEDGSLALTFAGDEPVELLLERAGRMPLPPISPPAAPPMRRTRKIIRRCSPTEKGAVAAPTASLHFTPGLMESLDKAGIGHTTLTLHVGAGTFLPVKAEDTDAHKMHAEWGRIDAATADRLNQVRRNGGRIIAAGTTSLRLIESAAGEDGIIHPL